MLPMIIPIASLLLGVSLLLLGNGLLNTLLALRGSLEGYSDSLIGLISSGYFLGYFVGFFLAIPLLRRIGHIRAFALCSAIAACVVLLHVLMVNPWTWMLLRVVTGTVMVILYGIIESWLNSQTPANSRGRVFAVYMVVNLVSLAIAQQFLRLDSPTSFTLFALAAMLVGISLAPITLTRQAQPQVTTVQRLPMKRLYKLAPVALAGALLSGVAMGAFWGLGPVYAQRIGFDSNAIAMFMSCAIIGGALFQLPLGRFSDTHDRRMVLMWIAVAAVIISLAMWLLPDSYWLVLGLMALWGGAAFAIYPVSIAHLVDHLEPGEALSGGSTILLLHGVGAAIGPAIAGQLMQLLSAHALPLFYAIALGTLALFSLKQMASPVQEEPGEPAPFVPMLRTTPNALEMLPDEASPTQTATTDSDQSAFAETMTEATTSTDDGASASSRS
jgi:MFS family permease